jgi:hypothetical protein
MTDEKVLLDICGLSLIEENCGSFTNYCFRFIEHNYSYISDDTVTDIDITKENIDQIINTLTEIKC